MNTQLMGSVKAMPRYPSHGTSTRTEMILIQSSSTEEAMGTVFLPIPCRLQRRTNSGPRAGKKQDPTFTYIAALSTIA